MLELVLPHFPQHTHPLTLVSDPDGVLADEAVRQALIARNFRLLVAADPVLFRREVQHAQPWSSAAPLLIVTSGALNELPYDLWQQGHHVDLALARLLPWLVADVVRALSVSQRDLLAQRYRPSDNRQLTHDATSDLLLELLFDLDQGQPRTVSQFVGWLDDYHSLGEPLPSPLRDRLIARLGRQSTFDKWPIAALLDDAAAYYAFVQRAWRRFLNLSERADAPYAVIELPFEQDRTLQDLLLRLVRNGQVAAVSSAAPNTMPVWVQAASTVHTTDEQPQLNDALTALEGELAAPELRWEQWQRVAQQWASLTRLRYSASQAVNGDLVRRIDLVQQQLDQRFASWLPRGYSQLAGRALPTPHHLYHVPGWLAHQREQQSNFRPVLLVLDGMALADWQTMRAVWQERHPAWHFNERLMLAQLPSITAVSRQALVSGLRPVQFASSMTNNRQEARHWASFWQARGLAERAVLYAQLETGAGAAYPQALANRYTQAVCLINRAIDDMVHGATQGTASVLSELELWLDQDDERQGRSRWLEGLIEHVCDLGYTVVITSDHGHVEAQGIGIPREGVLVQSRGKRARVYNNPDIVRVVQQGFNQTVLWQNDGLLPADVQVLMPQGRHAFTTGGELVVGHGGPTIDELIVPLITITRGT